MSQLVPLRRGMRILHYLAANHGGVPFKDLQSEFSGIGDASLSRLLTVMLEETLIVKGGDDGLYRLGDSFLDTARLAVNAMPREAIVQGILSKRAPMLGNTLSYWEGEGATLFLRAKEEVENSCAVRPVGNAGANITRHPAGHVYCAHQTNKALAFVLKHAKEPPVLGESDFKKHLKQVREDSFFHEGNDIVINATRIAAAVYAGNRNEYVGAVMVSAPGKHYTKKEKRQLHEGIVSVAREITQRLGGNISLKTGAQK